MTDRNAKDKIQQSMNNALSGLSPDFFLAPRVLRQAEQTKGEVKVKRLSGSLVFAIVLAIVLVTAAFALTNWESLKGYFETVRLMDTAGELARWSDADKIKLLLAMADANIVNVDDSRVQTALNESLPLSERGSAANAIITERYGEEYFDSYTVEQMEFPEESRSEEEHASFGQWSADYWEQEGLLVKQPLTESRIYRATMNNLTEVGDFPTALLRDVQVSSEWDEKERIHTITVSIDKAVYQASVKGTNHTSSFDAPSVGYECGDSLCFQFWLDEYGAFLGMKDLAEATAKLSMEEAQLIAEKALRVRLNVDAQTLKNLMLRSGLGDSGEFVQKDGRFTAAWFFIWSKEGDARFYVDVDAQTGRVITAFDYQESDVMLKKQQEWIAELQALLRLAGISDDLMNKQDVYIWHWSLQERAAWSQVARPIVHQYLSGHLEFAQYLEDLLANRYAQSSSGWPYLISLTQYAYGVPDEVSISQDKAFATARDVAIEMGASQKYIDENQSHVFYYDVTDPARPLWKVLIHMLFGDGDPEHPWDSTKPIGYFVVLDARTGEVLQVIQRTMNTHIQEIV
ncbi:MAG: hypothetical protein GX849_08195 [Clostridiaceae bacterium]|jgi:hypothetical protein|nr:hypothetical protein [Clostridiaceae bacterium]